MPLVKSVDSRLCGVPYSVIFFKKQKSHWKTPCRPSGRNGEVSGDWPKPGYCTEDRRGRRCPGLPPAGRQSSTAARGRQLPATQQPPHNKRRKKTLNSCHLGKQILLHPTFLLPSLLFISASTSVSLFLDSLFMRRQQRSLSNQFGLVFPDFGIELGPVFNYDTLKLKLAPVYTHI